MKNWLKITLAITAVAGVGAAVYYFTTGKNDKSLLQYLPKNCSALIKLDLPQIAELVSKHPDEIKELQFLKARKRSTPNPGITALIELIKNPKETGIDFSMPGYLFSESRNRGTAFGMLFQIRSSSEFAAFIRKYTPAGNETGEIGTIHFAEFDAGSYVSWNDQVALITSQTAENKSYFENILNRGNEIGLDAGSKLNQISNQKGMISMVLLIDEIMSSRELRQKSDDAEANQYSAIRNPFPKGTAFVADCIFDLGKVRMEASFIQPDKAKMEAISFIKPSGIYGKYEDKLFVSEIPYSAIAMSIDPEKLVGFMSGLSQEIKDDMDAIPFRHELLEYWNGDMAMGLSMSKANMDALKNNESTLESKSNGNTMLYFVTKKNITPLLELYARTGPDSKGIYGLQFGSETWWAIPTDELLTVCTDKTAIEKVAEKTFKNPPSAKALDFAGPKNAPLIGITDGSVQYDVVASSGLFPRPAEVIFKALKGTSVVYIDNGKLQYQMALGKAKENSMIALLQLIDDLMYGQDSKKQNLHEL